VWLVRRLPSDGCVTKRSVPEFRPLSVTEQETGDRSQESGRKRYPDVDRQRVLGTRPPRRTRGLVCQAAAGLDRPSPGWSHVTDADAYGKIKIVHRDNKDQTDGRSG
jgi:hypothetical protein